MKNSVNKNQEYVVDIIDNGFEGEGIAKIDSFTIFIPNTIKGEKVKILIVKVLSSHAFGKVLQILEKSENRIEPDCNTYKRCGGCNLRHVKYEKTLEMKKNKVQNLVNKSLNQKIEVEEVLGMNKPYFYRNKLQYPLGIDKHGNPIIGVYANRTHEIIPIEKCMIQDEESSEIAKYIVELIKKYNLTVYDEKTRKGLFRHVVIKKGFKTNEIMIILVINSEKLAESQEIVKDLIEKYNKIKTIVINSNMENTNVILGNRNETIYGSGYIEDILGIFKFKISPLSFYQVNPIQAEKLYNLALQNTEITDNDIVFDLYCGIGTISIFASKYAKKVYGIEIVEQAIEDAKGNAKINSISNTEFIAGDTEFVLTDLIENKKIIPDVVIVDPPRRGLDNTTINNILKIKPRKVTYISCNPATLVRDLKELSEKYDIKIIKPVDMFPWTSHCEVVTVLNLK